MVFRKSNGNETKKNPARINSFGCGFMFHFNLCCNPDIVAAVRGVVELRLLKQNSCLFGVASPRCLRGDVDALWLVCLPLVGLLR